MTDWVNTRVLCVCFSMFCETERGTNDGRDNNASIVFAPSQWLWWPQQTIAISSQLFKFAIGRRLSSSSVWRRFLRVYVRERCRRYTFNTVGFRGHCALLVSRIRARRGVCRPDNETRRFASADERRMTASVAPRTRWTTTRSNPRRSRRRTTSRWPRRCPPTRPFCAGRTTMWCRRRSANRRRTASSRPPTSVPFARRPPEETLPRSRSARGVCPPSSRPLEKVMLICSVDMPSTRALYR